MTKATLENNNKNNVDLILIPVKGEVIVNEAVIKDLIQSSEFKDLHVSASNIKNALAELNSALKPLQANQEGKEIRYQVLERIDARIEVSIEADEMSAIAEITTATGGINLSAKAILTAAQEAGVTKGFIKEELIKLAQKAAKEQGGATLKATIALGKEPINGKNAKVKLLVQSAQDRILKPKSRQDGSDSVDMRDLGDIMCVKVGDPLAQLVPMTDGVQGYTVKGDPIDPQPGDDIELVAGEGTIISTKNSNVLLSTLVGLPHIIENGVKVDEVYQISNVDISTGHIKFEGSVIISGDVCEGMKVVATGDITVGGFVESALLDAGGDITIGSGIIGKKQDVESLKVTDIQMSANINAKGKIYAKYAQYAEITCDGLRVENQMMHCIVHTQDKVWIGNEEKANGKLIGGHINAVRCVHAGEVGATAGSKTTVDFSQHLDTFRERISEVDVKIKEEADKTTELQIATEKLRKLPKDKANPEMLSKVTATYQFHAKRMGEFLNNKELIELELQEYMGSIYLEANARLYQGVEVIIGDFNDRSKREYGPSRMLYSERRILIDPIVSS